MNKLTEKAEDFLNHVRSLQLTKFTKEEKDGMEQKTLSLLEELCTLLLQTPARPTFAQEEKNILFSIFSDLFQELKRNRRILMRQELIEKLRTFKRRFFAVSQSDTCRTYITNLQQEAEDFQSQFERNPILQHVLDIFQELIDLVVRIREARSNIKKQQGLEAVTGVLSLGSTAASGALGIASVVVKAGGTVVAGSASAATGISNAAGSATKAAGLTASLADDAINAVGAATNIAASARAAANTGRILATAGSCLVSTVGIATETIVMGKTVAEVAKSKKKNCSFENSVDEVFEELCVDIDFDKDMRTQEATYSCVKTIASKIFEKHMAEK